MRSILPLSAGWEFVELGLDVPQPTRVEAAVLSGWRKVDLPHSMVEIPFNGFDERRLETRGFYRKIFACPERERGGAVFLDFEGVAVSCEVWVNGLRAGAHSGPYTPFSLRIDDALRFGGENEILVLVDSREDPQVPPFGGVVDYLVYGGIYRGVSLRFQAGAWIADTFARPLVRAIEDGRGIAALDVDTRLGGDPPPGAMLRALLAREGAAVAEAGTSIGADGGAFLSFPELKGLELWDIGAGRLYDLRLELRAPDAQGRDPEPMDELTLRIGFRQAAFTPEGFVLNGKTRRLRGLNRHQSWPYVGCAMGPGPQARDAAILAREMGLDIVRTSHYPQSRHFLDACDSLGLLVFTELPGWQHIGPEAWKLRALKDLESLILRDRNHPSVVLWGVRINESKDDDEFYARTAALAARLDPTRQTGGVRYIEKSRLLEDVYTFNDFTHEGGAKVLAPIRKVTGLKESVPFLVTEHSGHMFPTKIFDQEERRAEQARRHARILDLALGREEGCGAIGWCAFDYNTHKDFGSGDRICYHGVSDMFRIPKWAAFAYASQKEPERGVVLEPASLLAKGERSAARIIPFEVWTNCDAVDLYRAGSRVGRFYPDRKTYPHLAHPPVIIDDLIGERFSAEGWAVKDAKTFLRLASKAMSLGAGNLGLWDKLAFALLMARRKIGFAQVEALVTRYGMAWGSSDDELSFVGILGGKEAARRSFRSDASAAALRLVPEAGRIGFEPGGEWNAVRVLVEAVDALGNRVPYCFQPISVEISGPGRILGPACFSLASGASAFWVATRGEPGDIRIAARAPGLDIPGLGFSFSAEISLRAEVVNA